LIKGGDGNDTVRGFGGDDGLYPGFGDDVVDGGAGAGDVLGYSDIFTTGVHVDLSQTAPQDTNAGSDSLTGVENVDGTFKADTLIGDNGPNRLTGGGGTGDRLVGGLGDDDLQGSGPDVTVDYSKAPAARRSTPRREPRPAATGATRCTTSPT
jgi:Ca2+-binding RTX toxin-like protein